MASERGGPQDWQIRIAAEIATIAANFARLAAQAPSIAAAAEAMIKTLRAGGKIMLCGNGGSAADAQHLAAELVGRYRKDRAPLAALALTVDTSALTAIANDYAFEEVFARQVTGLGTRKRPCSATVGDLLALARGGTARDSETDQRHP